MLNVLLASSFFDSKCLVILQECATAQNELLKEFLEKIQARKKEVDISAVLFALIITRTCNSVTYMLSSCA